MIIAKSILKGTQLTGNRSSFLIELKTISRVPENHQAGGEGKIADTEY